MSHTKEKNVMFAVMVKPEARCDVCEDGKFWVKDETHEYYVTEKDRGLWKSKDDAGKAVTESYEEIVEVKMKTNEQKLHDFADRIESELNGNGHVVLDRQEAERLVKLMRESANEIFHFYQPVNNEQNHEN